MSAQYVVPLESNPDVSFTANCLRQLSSQKNWNLFVVFFFLLQGLEQISVEARCFWSLPAFWCLQLGWRRSGFPATACEGHNSVVPVLWWEICANFYLTHRMTCKKLFQTPTKPIAKRKKKLWVESHQQRRKIFSTCGNTFITAGKIIFTQKGFNN